MNSDFFKFVVIDSNESCVPLDPDLMPQIFRRNRIITSVHFHMTVPVDMPPTFPVYRKPSLRKRMQGFLFALVKNLIDLPLRGSMNPIVRYPFFPLSQVLI